MLEVFTKVSKCPTRTLTVFILYAVLAILHADVPADAAGLDEGWSLGGSSLREGEKATFTREFYAGVTYVIAASGDKDARDVDLRILDRDGRVVTEDSSSSRDASVTFRPKNTGRYSIELHLAEASARALCYFIIETPGRGWNVPERDVETVLTRLGTASTLSDLTGFESLPARFFGFVMKRGEKQSMNMNGIREGDYMAIAVADDEADDLDLEVRQNGRVLKRDIETDAVPVCIFRANTGSVEMEVSYETGSGPALVLMALYQKSLRSTRL
ncbi:MAG: hypothetical protein KatS3mg023_2682 [Armatimonadota bacterium]|nr:MAG: hypothetical protein KatS3mg023_2682 [Armatimonadota bacterium]